MMHVQDLDDFCADAIRRMRGMKSFNGVGGHGAMRRGQDRALRKFVRELRESFPDLNEQQLITLRAFAKWRACGWTSIESASVALTDFKP